MEPPSPISASLNNTMSNTKQESFRGGNTVSSEPEYRNWAVEDYVIKFLNEKAVAMREVPFMKATEALEFSANLGKVQNELMQLIPKDGLKMKKRTMQKPLPLD